MQLQKQVDHSHFYSKALLCFLFINKQKKNQKFDLFSFAPFLLLSLCIFLIIIDYFKSKGNALQNKHQCTQPAHAACGRDSKFSSLKISCQIERPQKCPHEGE